MQLTGHYEHNIELMDRLLRVQVNYDLIHKELRLPAFRAKYYLIDGLTKDNVLERVSAFLYENAADAASAEEFCARFVTYGQIDVLDDTGEIFPKLLAGNVVLIVEGFAKAVVIGAKMLPLRGITEPSSDQVLRGSRDGFLESVTVNTALLRKRIRDVSLTTEHLSVGSVSKTDVVLCYLDTRVDREELARLREKIKAIRVRSLAMGHESLAEELKGHGEWNPFPRIRYTERPDVAAANVINGKIVLLLDNSPVAMILPTYFFDFAEDSNDYYFPPLLGTYIRLIRLIVFISTVYLVPVWFLLTRHPESIPAWLDFIRIGEELSLPVIWQLIVVELAIGGLRIASLNTPASLGNSFSVIGALILGDLAIEMKLFVPQVVVFMGFAAISNFSQPSFELGYAFKFYRILLYLLVELLDFWGFLLGMAVMLTTMALTRTITGRSYLYPLIPFNGKKLFNVFFRKRLSQRLQ